jgi:hypothetical protein
MPEHERALRVVAEVLSGRHAEVIAMNRKIERAARQESARQEQLRAQAARTRRTRLVIAAGVTAAAAAVIALIVVQAGGDDPAPAATAPTASSVPSAQTTAGTPKSVVNWPAQASGLYERVASLGFPPGGDQSYHAHVLLSVYVDGQQVPVPTDIGFEESGAHSSLHSHTPDGVIHMEADDPYAYTLAHIMTTWGVPFDENILGEYTATSDKLVYVYINGKPATRDTELVDGDNVVVAYGVMGSFPTEPPTDALENA